MAACPRCQAALEAQQLDAFQFRLCRACSGILGRHADVMQVVDASWRAVTERTAEETPLHVKPEVRAEKAFGCPDCQQPMEKYGYLGMQAITIDRCDACALLWLDADELQNMVLALARDQYRLARAHQQETARRLNLGSAALPPAAHGAGVWLFPDRDVGAPLVLAQLLLRALLR